MQMIDHPKIAKIPCKKYGNIRLWNGDCMDLMQDKPDNYWDLAFTDPPYNVGRNYNEYDDSISASDYQKWCDSWFSELMRVSKTIVMTVGYKNLKYWINKDPKHVIIWNKPNQNSPSPIGGFNTYEPVFFWGKTIKRVGHDTITTNISMQPDANWHDCPKHLQSWKKILLKVSEPGASVVDIFSGSGTTAIACHDLGYECDTIEIDEDYYNDAVRRFEEHISQKTLFVQHA